MHRGHRNGAFYLASAEGAVGHQRIGKFLDALEAVIAFRALIFVKRHYPVLENR